VIGNYDEKIQHGRLHIYYRYALHLMLLTTLFIGYYPNGEYSQHIKSEGFKIVQKLDTKNYD
jgi:hypothetical protein